MPVVKNQFVVDDKSATIKELTKVRGIGEKLAIELYESGVRSIKDLIGRKDLPAAVKLYAKYFDQIHGRISMDDASNIKNFIRYKLICHVGFVGALVVGAHRRGIESEHDVDILVVFNKSPNNVVTTELLSEYLSDEKGFIGELARGPAQYDILFKIKDSIKVVEIYMTPWSEMGAALLHTTGPTTLNILLRKRAEALDMKLSQHGLFDKNGKVVAIGSETEIFNKLGLAYINPLDRDNISKIGKLIAGLKK